jgi:hypothetical protein
MSASDIRGGVKAVPDIASLIRTTKLQSFGANQNSGGTCPTFSGPKNTAPSTKRSGKARASAQS